MKSSLQQLNHSDVVLYSSCESTETTRHIYIKPIRVLPGLPTLTPIPATSSTTNQNSIRPETNLSYHITATLTGHQLYH